MPALIQLYEKYMASNNRFEIISLHGPGKIKKLDELFAQLNQKDGIVEKYWEGKQMPFPVLIDPAGQSWKDFGFVGYHEILINPKGELIRGGGKRELEEQLKKLESNPK